MSLTIKLIFDKIVYSVLTRPLELAEEILGHFYQLMEGSKTKEPSFQSLLFNLTRKIHTTLLDITELKSVYSVTRDQDQH